MNRFTCLVLCAVCTLAPLFAQEASVPGPSSPFRLDPVLEGLVLGSTLTLVATGFVLNAPGESNPAKYNPSTFSLANVPALDQPLMCPYGKDLDQLGTGLQVITLLSPVALLSSPKEEWFTIAGLYTETLLLAYGLKELGKSVVHRPRPFMYFPDPPKGELEAGDWNDSFPSGHSTLAFAGAAFTSYVFTTYLPDSPMRLPVIATSYALAVSTAATRLASGNHFLTDVVAGAALGTACGFLVPWVHSKGNLAQFSSTEKSGELSLELSAMGLFLSFQN